jgi:hypothetical protein
LSFITIVLFFGVFFFLGMGIDLGIFCKFKSPSTCENDTSTLHFQLHLSFDSTPFHAFGKAKNAFLLAITLWGSNLIRFFLNESICIDVWVLHNWLQVEESKSNIYLFYSQVKTNLKYAYVLWNCTYYNHNISNFLCNFFF